MSNSAFFCVECEAYSIVAHTPRGHPPPHRDRPRLRLDQPIEHLQLRRLTSPITPDDAFDPDQAFVVRRRSRGSRVECVWEDIRGGISVRQKIDEFSLDESCGFLRIVFDSLSQKIVHIGAKSGIGHVACQQCGKFRTPGP